MFFYVNFGILDIFNALFITVIADKYSNLQKLIQFIRKPQLIAKIFTDNIFTGDILLGSCITGESGFNKNVLFSSFYQWNKQYLFLRMQPRNGTIGL